MSDPHCESMEFLLQADVDGQLDIGETARLAAHLAQCPACRAWHADLAQISTRLRAALPYHEAPAALRRSLRARRSPRARLPIAFPAGIGMAVAAALLLALLPRGGDGMAETVVASHIRALQPGHLMDVVSTDRHTVKPWFDGRLDYAPPVKDLAAEGFPLAGGRLDYLAGRPVAALDYRRAKHEIDFFVWPDTGNVNTPAATGVIKGYNFVRWRENEMVFWVVSDLNLDELQTFVSLWRKR